MSIFRNIWSPTSVNNMLHNCSYEHKDNVYTPNLAYYKNVNNLRRHEIKKVTPAALHRISSTAQTSAGGTHFQHFL